MVWPICKLAPIIRAAMWKSPLNPGQVRPFWPGYPLRGTTNPMNHYQHDDKAALRGVPSLVWRTGQDRRLAMILSAAGSRSAGTILIDGCGTGSYLAHLSGEAR